jgi:small-conductance mechanosensitive channel
MYLLTQASEAPEVFGIRLVGLTATVGHKVVLSAIFIVALVLLTSVVSFALKSVMHSHERAAFWTQQVVRIVAAVIFVLGLLSIWVSNPSSLATGAGLVTAGVAVALQRVITSFAAYLIILRGKLFTVGDRITMGGVRGDVVALGFMQTTVMEMGEAPGEQEAPPATWVRARQYTGRIVRVTNDKIFDSPVYNYTREFPFVWEEMHIPISYKDKREEAERIILEAARKHTARVVEEARPALEELAKTYSLHEGTDLEPRVFWQLTDNWIAMNVRFIAPVRSVRGLKDAISREIITEFDKAKIGIASGTYEIVGVPPLKVDVTHASA